MYPHEYHNVFFCKFNKRLIVSIIKKSCCNIKTTVTWLRKWHTFVHVYQLNRRKCDFLINFKILTYRFLIHIDVNITFEIQGYEDISVNTFKILPTVGSALIIRLGVGFVATSLALAGFSDSVLLQVGYCHMSSSYLNSQTDK